MLPQSSKVPSDEENHLTQWETLNLKAVAVVVVLLPTPEHHGCSVSLLNQEWDVGTDS